ncbi:MAG: hypothetical protein F8N37_11045 [Telmatospirillum sp.]|nr:hypothetical protein [Telmatospirillum sp.]
MFHDCRGRERWANMPRPARFAGCAIMGLLVVGSFALLFGSVTMLLWNAIIPEISSLPVITFWQAVGLLVLARLLTGRFSHGHGYHGRRRFGRHRPGMTTPEQYAEWWETEGEAAFRAYNRRQKGDDGRRAE